MAELKGMDELLRVLENVATLVERKTGIARALRAGGKVAAERMRQLAPDDPDTAGSRVKDSIKVEVAEQSATGAIAYVGPDTKGFVAIFAELGTIHQPARPFIRPAGDEKEDEVARAVGEVLAAEIEALTR